MQHVFTDPLWSVRAGDKGMVQNERTCFVRSIKSHLEPIKINLYSSSSLPYGQLNLLIKGSLGGKYQNSACKCQQKTDHKSD